MAAYGVYRVGEHHRNQLTTTQAIGIVHADDYHVARVLAHQLPFVTLHEGQKLTVCQMITNTKWTRKKMRACEIAELRRMELGDAFDAWSLCLDHLPAQPTDGGLDAPFDATDKIRQTAWLVRHASTGSMRFVLGEGMWPANSVEPRAFALWLLRDRAPTPMTCAAQGDPGWSPLNDCAFDAVAVGKFATVNTVRIVVLNYDEYWYDEHGRSVKAPVQRTQGTQTQFDRHRFYLKTVNPATLET